MQKFAALCLLAVIGAACGSPAARVVGGVDAVEGQFPHQISLRRGGSLTCGGSILTRNYVLTAAHCVGTDDANGVYYTYDPSIFTIRAGSNDRLTGGVVVQVAAITAHELYGNFNNDVALLRLSQPLIYSKNIQPVPLASREVPPGEDIIISGWGRLKQAGDLPRRLQWNTLKSLSRAECKEAINWDLDSLICLAHQVANGACNGDSGGPALYNGEVVGVAGFVYGGCGTANPDGYAKVYYHREWIREHSDL